MSGKGNSKKELSSVIGGISTLPSKNSFIFTKNVENIKSIKVMNLRAVNRSNIDIKVERAPYWVLKDYHCYNLKAVYMKV